VVEYLEVLNIFKWEKSELGLFEREHSKERIQKSESQVMLK
jgi:hypothetical protein